MTSTRPTLSPLASLLGWGGVAPGVLLFVAALGGLMHEAHALRLMLIYVAAILAFLGGAQWAFALAHPQLSSSGRRLIVAVLAALWAALSLLLPSILAGGALITGLVLLMTFEVTLRADGVEPEHYLPLRLRLTGALALSLLAILLLVARAQP